MPGVYLEYIKAGRFVVPVELTFQTENIQSHSDHRGYITTSKWIERHNWKEIKAMLKPAVQACLKYNETPLESIPKSHHISYGREVSLGYLIVPNQISSSLLSILDTKKNCWTDDEDDDEEESIGAPFYPLKEHETSVVEFTEFIPTKTAIRVCVVRKSIVSIDDARRIRKELGVRSEDVRHYFSSAALTSNDPGPSTGVHNYENFDKDKRVSEWATSTMYSHLRDSESVGLTSQPTQSSSANLFNSNQEMGDDDKPSAGATPPLNDPEESDSEVENIPRTFGDPDEIRDAARIYPHVIARDNDSGEDPDDDELSLPDIEPNPPKRKKGTRSRKKSASLSPTKAKRLTHNNILAISQEGQTNFSEEDTTYNKKGTKKTKRKRTVAVVEPMRTLPNGQVSFELAIGALGSEKRRKARPGSSHGTDKTHSGGGRSKQPPAIDIVAPDDDRLTITNPPEPLDVGLSTSHFSPFKELDRHTESGKKKKKKKRKLNIDEDPYKYERLTPSPLFDTDDDDLSGGYRSRRSETESDIEMPVLVKMVDSDEEINAEEDEDKEENEDKEKNEGIEENEDKEENESKKENEDMEENEGKKENEDMEENEGKKENEEKEELTASSLKLVIESESQKDDKVEEEKVEKNKTPVVNKEPKEQASPDITQIKVNATTRKKTAAQKKSYKRQLKMSDSENDDNKSDLESGTTKLPQNLPEYHNRNETITRPDTENTTHHNNMSLRSDTKLAISDINTCYSKERINASDDDNDASACETPSPVQMKPTVTSPLLEESKEIAPFAGQSETPKQLQLVKRRKRLRKVHVGKKEAEKPKMADSQTQTDDLLVVAQIERNFNCISNAVVKVSRSCDVSSDDEFYERTSLKSRRSTLASPFANSEASQALSVPAIHHPALGSPDTEQFEDDGLFSFESPTIPVLSSSQTPVVTLDQDDSNGSSEHFLGPQDSPERDNQEDENDNVETENSHEELSEMQSPSSPQPGCSHWSTPPVLRARSPPPSKVCDLMPPPISRPPRTPRKVFDRYAEDLPPRLSIGSPEPVDDSHEDEVDNEPEMPAGTEAGDVSVSGNVGRLYHVLNQPSVLKAGMRLIHKVATEEDSAQELENTLRKGRSRQAQESELNKALVPVSTARRKRDLSPDICDIVPDKRLRLAVAARRSRKESFDETGNKSGSGESRSKSVVLRHITSDDEASDTENSNNNDKLMEYITKSKFPADKTAYEPIGDEFDLSQRSYCMLNVVPQYDVKSRLYKMHSKAVRETPVQEVLQHYKMIQHDLYEIFQGNLPSVRHSGFEAKRDLRNLNVTVPFTSEQGSALVTMIYDKLVPDKTMRCDYMDYVNYVLVPEAFIRIYSRINNIPYEMAEVEMRFRACYEGEVPSKYLSLPLD